MTTAAALRLRLRGDHGSSSTEMVILAPAVLLLFGLLLVGGRVTLAHQHVQHAASEAARTASLARTPAAARSDSLAAASSTLARDGLSCTSTAVDTDTSAFARTVGTAATITSQVTCTVSLGELSVPGIGGSRTITATATSPLDTYRGRDG